MSLSAKYAKTSPEERKTAATPNARTQYIPAPLSWRSHPFRLPTGSHEKRRLGWNSFAALQQVVQDTYCKERPLY